MVHDDLIHLMSRLARYSGEDETTGLRNLRQFLRDAERELARSRRTGEELVVLVVEPDSGFAAADLALLLKECVLAEDLVARIGSRSFGLLVAGSSDRFLTELSQSDLKSITAFWVGERRVKWPDGHSVPAATLLQDALAALERAKENGGDCHVVWQEPEWVVH